MRSWGWWIFRWVMWRDAVGMAGWAGWLGSHEEMDEMKMQTTATIYN